MSTIVIKALLLIHCSVVDDALLSVFLIAHSGHWNTDARSLVLEILTKALILSWFKEELKVERSGKGMLQKPPSDG